MKAGLPAQLVWAVALVTAPAVTAGAVVPASWSGPLLWAAPGERAVPGEGDGCAAVLLEPSWALLSTRCLADGPPYNLMLVGPGEDGDTTAAKSETSAMGRGGEAGTWNQRRRVVEVVLHPNQAASGAAEFPALALARAERPFALGASGGLRAAPVLQGALDEARGPLRCNFEGWETTKPNTSMPDGTSANFTEPNKTLITTVLTHEQCRVYSLVEQASQVCVQVPAQTNLQGGPLLCGTQGALVAMHDIATRFYDGSHSLAYRYDVFTNVSDLGQWLSAHVPRLRVVSSDGGLARFDVVTPKGSHKSTVRPGKAAGTRTGPVALMLLTLLLALLL